MQNSSYISDQFNTWQKCKKRYYFKYIKELSWPETGSNFKLGTSVHALINYHLKGFSVDNLLKNTDTDILNCWNNIKDHPILKNQLIVSEWSFNSRISNCWLNGRIDAVFFDRSINKYIIADWKTGKAPKNPEDNFQHMIYLYSFFNAQKDLKLNFNYEDLVFQYIYINDDAKIVSFLYSKDYEKEAAARMTHVIENIASSKGFEKTIECPIKSCQYQQLCESPII